MKNLIDALRKLIFKTTVKYVCAECQQPAYVVDGRIERKCLHSDAGVLANVSATATGKSRLAG